MVATSNDKSGSNASLDFEPISGSDAFREASGRVIANARLQLSLMSVKLDGRVYASEAFTNQLRNFILDHRRARLRVLVHDPRSAVQQAVRLVELGRSLSSRIEFREVPADIPALQEEYFIADERSLLFRSGPDQLEGRYYDDAPMVARSQLKAFDALWDQATVAREMTALGL
tara:strand:+ start:2640 stop:3158 length:519 start_codon:yes stop_codon:yes gene_type:complete